MSTKLFHRAIFPLLMGIAVAAIVGGVLARYGVNDVTSQDAARTKPAAESKLVDERPLATARRLALLAKTPDETAFAQNALRLADNEVDLAFAAALRTATLHPPAVPAAARPLLAHVQRLQDHVKQEQADVARLKQLLAKAEDDKKLDLDEKFQLAAATLDVDEQELDAAREELIRAGGDPRSKIQQLLDQHEASSHHAAAAAPAGAAPRPETRMLLVQFRAWRELVAKSGELAGARDEVQRSQADLGREREAWGQETKAEGSKAESAPPPGSSAAATPSAGSERYALLKRAAEGHRHLAELDKRASDLQQLDAVYRQWSDLLATQIQAHRRRVIEGIGWIAALLLLVLLAKAMARFMIARLGLQSRQRHTVQMITRLGLQAMGALLILIVLFGPPSQLATVVALAGAGLTVALKDFIVGFFGWFILMGKNGIHPGDWVEIQGIGGEVVEVGLLHTVILETGDWSDAGHPTGRKVTFVNSFAIEGHYFNFSTTGQWLWDELEVPVPAGADPYPIAEAVHRIVVAETEANARLAEQEWQRVVPGHVGQTFAAVPAISVRPTTLGVNVIVRYITRAHERHELRARLFHKTVELLRSAHIASAPLKIAAGKAAQSSN
jgi:small-conductance mechanosensitive channel